MTVSLNIEKVVAGWVVSGDLSEEDAAEIAVLLKTVGKILPPEALARLCEQYPESWRSLRDDPALFRKRKRELARADRAFRKRLDEFNREGPEAAWSNDLKKLRAFHEKNWPEHTWTDAELLAVAKRYRDSFKVK